MLEFVPIITFISGILYFFILPILEELKLVPYVKRK